MSSILKEKYFQAWGGLQLIGTTQTKAGFHCRAFHPLSAAV